MSWNGESDGLQSMKSSLAIVAVLLAIMGLMLLFFFILTGEI